MTPEPDARHEVGADVGGNEELDVRVELQVVGGEQVEHLAQPARLPGDRQHAQAQPGTRSTARFGTWKPS